MIIKKRVAAKILGNLHFFWFFSFLFFFFWRGWAGVGVFKCGIILNSLICMYFDVFLTFCHNFVAPISKLVISLFIRYIPANKYLLNVNKNEDSRSTSFTLFLSLLLILNIFLTLLLTRASICFLG